MFIELGFSEPRRIHTVYPQKGFLVNKFKVLFIALIFLYTYNIFHMCTMCLMNRLFIFHVINSGFGDCDFDWDQKEIVDWLVLIAYSFIHSHS